MEEKLAGSLGIEWQLRRQKRWREEHRQCRRRYSCREREPRMRQVRETCPNSSLPTHHLRSRLSLLQTPSKLWHPLILTQLAPRNRNLSDDKRSTSSTTNPSSFTKFPINLVISKISSAEDATNYKFLENFSSKYGFSSS
ncbi:hypothetical protein PIB30_006289 [Stylosanthes scabra]|uniref:Uncharacterized protein n=1 Tax=Stylosanthes scabra TaxID=79078 RepID=A0ABU6Q4E7_9FABA|nr:hypothetical protein [Stylosanthes scabra]